ncbi:MAG: hypothetical protein Q8828_02230, partial [Candidatus Phytoplasma australasiaticum]|nr:hypothetical protein [Candidatus Phytoplasma australasiaticum]
VLVLVLAGESFGEHNYFLKGIEPLNFLNNTTFTEGEVTCRGLISFLFLCGATYLSLVILS